MNERFQLFIVIFLVTLVAFLGVYLIGAALEGGDTQKAVLSDKYETTNIHNETEYVIVCRLHLSIGEYYTYRTNETSGWIYRAWNTKEIGDEVFVPRR